MTMARRAFRERCGKALRARHQQRASLVLARQCIDEYLEPEGGLETAGVGTVPLTRRHEFRPTASFQDQHVATSTQQMDLPFVPGWRSGAAAALSSGRERRETRAVALPWQTDPRGEIVSLSHGSGRRFAGRFSWAQFAYGLLLGGAGAAVALLLLRWSLG
jgi:hypothetical protein